MILTGSLLSKMYFGFGFSLALTTWSRIWSTSSCEQRRRLLAAADEAGDLGGVLDDVPGVVGHLHLDQDVAREELALQSRASCRPGTRRWSRSESGPRRWHRPCPSASAR